MHPYSLNEAIECIRDITLTIATVLGDHTKNGDFFPAADNSANQIWNISIAEFSNDLLNPDDAVVHTSRPLVTAVGPLPFGE